MTRSEERFFNQGKLARFVGQFRDAADRRLTPKNRNAWREGWDWQDNHELAKKETPEARELRKKEGREAIAEMKRTLETR